MGNTSTGIHIGPVTITIFALVSVVALGAAAGITAFRARRNGGDVTLGLDLGSYILVFSLLLGRLLYVLVPPPSVGEFYTSQWYLAHPFDLLAGPVALWNGGLEPAGALLGVMLSALLLLYRRHLDLKKWSDILLPGMMAGAIILPWANLFEGQMLGPETSLPWGIPIGDIRVHPTPIYVSLWGLIAFGVAVITQIRSKRQWPQGMLALVTGLIYLPGLFLADMLRVDASRVFPGLSITQLTVVILEIALAVLLARRLRGQSDGPINFTEN